MERAGGRGTKVQVGEAEDASPRRRPARLSGATDSASRSRPVAPSKKTIALVYDFDGTLSPKPMQEYAFLPKLGIEPKEFWAECTRVAKAERADALITYMHLLYKRRKRRACASTAPIS